MAVLDCYDAVADFLGPEPTSRLILPKLVYLLYENALNEDQFERFISTIRVYIYHYLFILFFI